MPKQQIGIVGMAVMGRNLALNLENRGYSVSIFNRTTAKTNEILIENPDKNLIPFYKIKEFVNSLEKPRRILLMVKAGQATDKTISIIAQYLEHGDILIDGGNSYYKDTIRRNKELSSHGFNFIGTGVSGGEEGALKGPSFMPGGQKDAYELIAPIFSKIAAVFQGEACISYIGPNGSGHYVKMIHNGIEYGDMQLISEAYFLLKYALQMNNDIIAEIFKKWNDGELNSYLIDITSKIFTKKNIEGNYLIDLILDEAENKGTGQWASQSALDLNEPLSLITQSVFARYISSLKTTRMKASKILSGPKCKIFRGDKKKFIEQIRRALYLGKIISYSQGFAQLKAASKKYQWNLNYGDISKIFRAGCIIRSQFLEQITQSYTFNPELINLLFTPYFSNIASQYQMDLRKITSYAVQNGIPVPTFSSAISYYDSYRSENLPANLIQAQRDYFGSHTYKRIDKEGLFHTKWTQ
ncbi:6-phosphogluconate dehydrogenase, decarboxylating [Candidatus Erwinia haradaeae]|uniref:6-phosphogluconate dehydrogenase, decarboxylating n=1 Tax=Candidatus Erwinia haradaeae TaxID=1922217 RepID=A0A451CZB4_9GAMM|nr:NADP-dependent phosphogluconate dehydrogenase [Candidatus Erwinia haradaeae]VFP78530.1 6-phosphogluconate dehydrogenase, decarboxylating [Candidatus Erwinia haradaeae]